MKTKEVLLTTRQAAQMANVTYDGLTKAIQSGRIKRFIKIGNRNYFYADDIREYQQRREARANAE